LACGLLCTLEAHGPHRLAFATHSQRIVGAALQVCSRAFSNLQGCLSARVLCALMCTLVYAHMLHACGARAWKHKVLRMRPSNERAHHRLQLRRSYTPKTQCRDTRLDTQPHTSGEHTPIPMRACSTYSQAEYTTAPMCTCRPHSHK